MLFLLVVLGEQFARADSMASTLLTIIGWTLWSVFAVEFLARMVVAPSTGRSPEAELVAGCCSWSCRS